MSGTTSGGVSAAATNKKKYGNDFYKRIAIKAQAKWDENGRAPRGFAYNPDLAREAGKIGGRNGKRTFPTMTDEQRITRRNERNAAYRARQKQLLASMTPEEKAELQALKDAHKVAIKAAKVALMKKHKEIVG